MNTVDYVDIFKKIVHEVFNELGFGYSESVYQNAIEVELRYRGISYVAQPILPIYYKGVQVGTHRPDLIVESSLVVELKTSSTHLQTKDIEQLKRYLAHMDKSLSGLAIHIGPQLTQMWYNKEDNNPINSGEIVIPQTLDDDTIYIDDGDEENDQQV